IAAMRHDVIKDLVARHVPANTYPEQGDMQALAIDVMRVFNLELPCGERGKEDGIDEPAVYGRLRDAADGKVAERVAAFGPNLMRQIEKTILLQSLDQHWKEHLAQLDSLRQVIGLRAYAQRDPLNEYRAEAFALFEHMLAQTRDQVVTLLAHVEIQPQTAPPTLPDPDLKGVRQQHIDPLTGENDAESPAVPFSRKAAAEVDPDDPSTWGRVSRNAPCPCGSGKKYKHCHGAV